MCGIVGVINKKGERVEREMIDRMNRVMIHRGPDADGVFVENNIGLGHRRLSIVDLSEDGNQPMYSGDEKFVIVYNGEIYNYCELKEQLQEAGATFHNDTDTEVILEAYRYWGMECTEKFNGMWSFALYDREKKGIFFSRDRFGVKPLYVLDMEDKFLFASEIKCITEICPEQKIVDIVQIARYLENVQEDSDEHTFYKNIHNFPKSHNMFYDLNSNRMVYKKFWEINVPEFKKKWKTNNPCKMFRTLFEDAVKIRLRADVEVGASLSGGLDSSTIVSIVHKKYGIKMNTFSSIYSEKNCNEKEFIDCVNSHADTTSHYIYPDESNDILNDMKELLYYHDGPCQSASPYSGYCVYRGVKNRVKVLLDGQGADELFGGYLFLFNGKIKTLLEKKTLGARIEAIRTIAAFQTIWPQKVSLLKEDLLVEALGVQGYRYFVKKYMAHSSRENWTRKDLLRKEFLDIDLMNTNNPNETIRNTFDKELNSLLEYKMLPRILHDVDRNSMASSLEVRLPFLDYRLVEFSYSLDDKYKIRGGWTKYIMRKSCKKYLPKKIRTRRNKMGFPAPFDKWLRDERYKEEIRNYLVAFKERNIVNDEKLDSYYKEHIEGKMDRSEVLFRVMMLEIWLENEIDRQGKKWKYTTGEAM